MLFTFDIQFVIIIYNEWGLNVKEDLKRRITILSLALYVAGNSVVSGTIGFMQQDLAISLTNAEFLITLSSITSIIAILFSEKITNALSMKKCVNIGLILVGLSSLLPVISTTYISVVISRLILGAGIGLFNGHSANYINVFYEGEEADRLHGIRSSAEFIGQIVLLFIAGLLIKIHWQYAFLSYFFAFIIMINFNRTIPDVEIPVEEGKFRINKQIVYYVFMAAMIIMNLTAVSVRFPTIAILEKGINVDANMYMMILPISGMIFGFMFGYINRALKEKTMLLGLFVYVVTNLALAFFGKNMYFYLLAMVFIAFSQALCTPYLFAEVARFVKGKEARIANNLIFVGCNIGGFLAPFFLEGINKILNTDSLTISFVAFSLIYGITFIVNLREYGKIKRTRRAV